MRLACDKCRCEDSKVISIKETIEVRGEEIEVNSNVRVCNQCENELFDEELEEENLKRAYEIYRKNNKILKPEEVENIREKYGLSQRSLSKVLGWGEITVHRYETGAVPDPSHNKVLKLLENPEIMKGFLIDAQDLIPRTTFKRALENINKLLVKEEQGSFLKVIEYKIQEEPANVESGFRRFNIDKFINAVLYFANEVPNLWKTKLNKALFYSDFTCFKKYVFSITGLKYIKLDYDPVPVPDDYEGLLWAMEKAKLIEQVPAVAGNYSGTIIKPLVGYDLDILKKEEAGILQEVKDKIGNMTASEISEKSHKEKAWKETTHRNIISYKNELNELIG